MTQENYREKIEEHRQEIEFDGSLERKSRTSKKSNKRKSRLIRNMTIFFIFIPLLILGYVHFFYEPKSLAEEKDPSFTLEPNKPSIENNSEQIAAAEKEKAEKEAEEKAKAEKEAAAKEKAAQEAEAKAKAEKEAVAKAKAEKEAAAKEKAEREAAAKIQAEKEAAAKAQAEKQAKEDAQKLAAAKKHVVQPNENLYRISLKYYSDGNGVQKIMQANNLSSENIVVGQTLLIPQ